MNKEFYQTISCPIIGQYMATYKLLQCVRPGVSELERHCSHACLLKFLVQAQVLPEVYGGDAELVPAEEAVLKRLMQQQQERKQSKQAAKRKASTTEAVKSSRVASAGRVLSRWSSSAWSVAKKPAVVSLRCLAPSSVLRTSASLLDCLLTPVCSFQDTFKLL